MTTETEVNALQMVHLHMQDGINLGLTVHEAAEAALQEIKRRGLWGEFCLAFITTGRVAESWRTFNQGNRAALSRPGVRRVDTSQLGRPAGRLESLWPVNGIYKRLGSLTVEEVQSCASMYASLERDNGAKRRYFQSIARRIEGGQVVEDVFDDEQLALLEEAAQGEG